MEMKEKKKEIKIEKTKKNIKMVEIMNAGTRCVLVRVSRPFGGVAIHSDRHMRIEAHLT